MQIKKRNTVSFPFIGLSKIFFFFEDTKIFSFGEIVVMPTKFIYTTFLEGNHVSKVFRSNLSFERSESTLKKCILRK